MAVEEKRRRLSRRRFIQGAAAAAAAGVSFPLRAREQDDDDEHGRRGCGDARDLNLVNGRFLTMDARNTVDAPEAIYPVKISAERKGSTLVIRLPPKSVSVLRLQ